MSDAINQFAEHVFVEEIVLWAIEGHARDAGFEMEFHELKIGWIAAAGIGANLDVAVGQSGAACFHGSFSFRNASKADGSTQGAGRPVGAEAKCAKSLLAEETGKAHGVWFASRTRKEEKNRYRVDYTIWTMNRGTFPKFDELPTTYALLLKESSGTEGFPTEAWWERAPAIRFERDWRGEQSDPQRATEVRLLWNEQTLFLRFLASYRELHVFPDARADGWRDELWERDVAEAFLQPDANYARVYKELEVSPNGYWIDLNIAHGGKEEMRSGLRRRVAQDAAARMWTAELAVPMRSLTTAFDPKRSWRANFFRVEGKTEPRFYSAWSPTLTQAPNFHVPEAFGHLIFREAE
jgi:hypothetical protein